MQQDSATLIRELGMNAGLLAMLAVLYGLAARRSLHPEREVRRARNRWLFLLGSLMFAAIGMVAMIYPVSIAPGLIMDAKTLVAALAGAYLPIFHAVVAVVFMAGYREYLGGVGAHPAILALVLNLLVGWGMRRARQSFEDRLGSTFGQGVWLVAFGLLSALVTVASMLTLPAPMGTRVASLLLVPMFVTVPVAIAAMGFLLDSSIYLREREISLAQTARQLRESLAELKQAASVFLNSQDTICIMTPDGVVLDVNPAFCRALGYSREELLGQPSSHLRVTEGGDTWFLRKVARDIATQGHWHGELVRKRKNGDPFVSEINIEGIVDEDGVVRRWVSVGKDLTEKKRLEEEVAKAANYDPLTGLPNRRMVTQQLQGVLTHASVRQDVVAVCVIDLDNFKSVVDRVGTSGSDDILRRVASLLREGASEHNLLGRLGGDEFAVVLNHCLGPDDAQARLDAVRQSIKTHFASGHDKLELSCSGGITFYPADNGDADALLRHADLAMFTAKEQGKDRLFVYDVHRDALVQNRIESIARIESALRAGEMELFFQPKVCLHDGMIVGAESLIRWRHPERGLLAPGAFLGLIEGSAVANELDYWVLAEALRIADGWRRTGTPLAVSVNVTVSTLVEQRFLTELRKILGHYPDLPAGCLELELLESETMNDLSLVSFAIQELASVGVQCSIDDFGTGYSSLSYLQRLPAQIIKIDQSFVRDMLVNERDRALVRGVIGLAKAFDRVVVAEGVETDQHAAMLNELGCDVLQGYGIARPMPASEVPDWVARWHMPAAFVSHSVRATFDDLVKRVRE
jgi:diguanylate cyclase (GGDEF)-like protein/PAS domain S-box-containing protein